MNVDPGIRRMEIGDTSAVVALHLAAFQGFFLSFLGPTFLKELYSSIVWDPTGISFVCCQDGRMLGFVAGAEHPAGFYRRLIRQRWWRFALASIKPVLLRPTIVPRLFRALKKPTEVAAAPKVGTLMSIGVLQRAQRQGIANSLVWAFLSEARQRGLVVVNLTTDRVNNEDVNRFYERLGFRIVRTFTTPEGREMNEYAITLSE